MNQSINLLKTRIVVARKKAGISQKNLSALLGIAYQTLNKYEKGHRTPDAELLRQMANILKCDPGWLLTGESTTKEVEMVCETQLNYKYKSGDPELNEIFQWLKDNPSDKKLFLQFIKGRKLSTKALEGLKIDKPLIEEGT